MRSRFMPTGSKCTESHRHTHMGDGQMIIAEMTCECGAPVTFDEDEWRRFQYEHRHAPAEATVTCDDCHLGYEVDEGLFLDASGQ